MFLLISCVMIALLVTFLLVDGPSVVARWSHAFFRPGGTALAFFSDVFRRLKPAPVEASRTPLFPYIEQSTRQLPLHLPSTAWAPSLGRPRALPHEVAFRPIPEGFCQVAL